MNALRAAWYAAGYEATRLRTRRSTLGVFALAMFGSGSMILPAVRGAVETGAPQTRVAWVVAGGVVGTILPGALAVLAAAWLGAGLVTEDYRYGTGLTTYTRLPRRGAELLGKVLVAGCVGLWLAILTRLSAYLTALGGFALARGSGVAEHVHVGAALILPTLAESLFALVGGVAGVLCAPVLRLRMLAAGTAWLLTALFAALTPGSRSPYTPEIASGIARIGLPERQTAMALPEVLAVGLVLAALLTVRRRRID